MPFNPLESFNEGIFRQDVARLGGEALKQRADINAGVPDRLCWLPSSKGPIWFWAEWKRWDNLGKTVPAHQQAYHDRLRAAGHLVFVFNNNAEARGIMSKLLAGETT